MRSILSTLTSVAVLAVSFITSAPYALAATAPANPSTVGQALEIAPPVITLAVAPGQTTTALIYLRDISKTDLIVTGTANDFIAAGEDGTPKILLEPGETSPYSMKSWIGALPTLRLIPREIKAMTVRITVPANASPGGHYGVIRFTATPPDIKSTGVSLSASLGALLLVTVGGNITEKVAVDSFSATQNNQSGVLFEAPPINFASVFKNTGNVHEQPTGQITITDMLGHKLAALNVNLPPRNILPDSKRKFMSALDSTVIGDKVMFGRYTADLSVTYGSNKTPLKAQVVFWIIPYRLIIVVTVALVAAFFGLRFLIRRYNSHIIAQSQRTRRR